jgi:chromosome segregation ATPase
MAAIPIWRTLVRLKARRIERQEGVVAEALASVRECEAGLEKARAAEAHRQEGFENAQRALFDLYGGAQSFSPDLALMRKRQIDASEQELKQAQHETSVHEQRVATVREELRDARAHLQRLEQQARLFKDELEKAIREAAQAQEDTQDEDAEETAVARMIGMAIEARATADEMGSRA